MSDTLAGAQIARLNAETEKLRTERRVLVFMAGVKCVVSVAVATVVCTWLYVWVTQYVY